MVVCKVGIYKDSSFLQGESCPVADVLAFGSALPGTYDGDGRKVGRARAALFPKLDEADIDRIRRFARKRAFNGKGLSVGAAIGEGAAVVAEIHRRLGP